MTVNVTDIQDYLDWKMTVNINGIQDSVQDFAEYRERLDQEKRVETTVALLTDYLSRSGLVDAQYVYELLTGVEYRPDDV